MAPTLPSLERDILAKAGKLILNSHVEVSCAPYLILYFFNTLTPKRWEEERVVVFANGEKHVSTCFVEMGHYLGRVALLSSVQTCLFSMKEAACRGIDVCITSSGRCIFQDKALENCFSTNVEILTEDTSHFLRLSTLFDPCLCSSNDIRRVQVAITLLF